MRAYLLNSLSKFFDRISGLIRLFLHPVHPVNPVQKGFGGLTGMKGKRHFDRIYRINRIKTENIFKKILSTPFILSKGFLVLVFKSFKRRSGKSC